jgi:deoxycytidine triphosphate deaminase
MPILNKRDVQSYIDAGQLVLHPLRDAEGNPVVEPASYDLRAGIVLWKNGEVIERRDFDEQKLALDQPIVTLRPGQMIFVISHEELKLPETISATVYSRNKLQKQNILALNAGHIDPGYEGPIIIRLINLSSIPWALPLGDAIFTVTFHTVKDGDNLDRHPRRTKEETLQAAMKTAAEAFSNPFHDLYKDQIKKQLDEHYAEVENRLREKFSAVFFRKNQVTEFVVAAIAAIILGLAVATRIRWSTVWNWCKWILHIH